MFVTYKTTNMITGQFYIGSHKTDNINDDYMGSGRFINLSIQKYGIENHKKEILGVFNTREESLALEHKLVMLKKKEQRELVLNKTNGGFSFDHINCLDRRDKLSQYGRLGAIKTTEKNKIILQQRIETYNKNPNLCKYCNKPLQYAQRHNKFCCKSCSAKFNNNIRHLKCINSEKTKIIRCLYCNKEFEVLKYSIEKFCCPLCRTRYKLTNNKGSKQLQYFADNLDYILQELKYKSIRKIALSLNVSHSYLAWFVKNYQKYTNESTEVFDMANIDRRDTGLPVDIWVDTSHVGKNVGHKEPRLKIQAEVTNDHRRSNIIPVSISKKPRILAGTCKLNSRQLNMVYDFIVRNYDILISHWNGEITDRQLLNNLQV